MKKKVIIIVGIVIILVLMGVGFFVWDNKYKEAVRFCEEDCVYHVGGWRHSPNDRIIWLMVSFDIEEQCISSCLDANYFLRAFKR